MNNLNNKKVQTVGIWFGFTFPVSSKREGISRYSLYLVESLLNSTQINFEIWCYEFNKVCCEELFSSLIASNRVQIVTEIEPNLKRDKLNEVKKKMNLTFIEKIVLKLQSSKNIFLIILIIKYINFKPEFNHFKHIVKMVLLHRKKIFLIWGVFGTFLLCDIFLFNPLLTYLVITITYIFWIFKNNIYNIIKKIKSDKIKVDLLVERANQTSKADLFLVPHVSLLNSHLLKKKKLIAVHDLVTISFFDDFIKFNYNFWDLIKSNVEILKGLSNFAKNGDHFVSNCEYVMQNEVLKLVPNVNKKNCHFVYLPVNIPKLNKLVNDKMILKKFNITKGFLFYPTQIRPYKNILFLIKVLEELISKGYDLQLVLTSKTFNNNHELIEYSKKTKLINRIILTGDVEEGELFQLHKLALVTVAPSRFEGGLPWPALEAFNVGTPAVLGNIPQTLERLKFVDPEVGFNSSGLLIADVNSVEDFTDKIISAIENREKVILNQNVMVEKIEKYNWEAAANKYINIFDEMI